MAVADLALADGALTTCADDRVGRCSTSTIVNGVCGKMNSMTDSIDNSNATLQREYKKYTEMLEAAKTGTVDASRRQALITQQNILKEARLECAAEIRHCDSCSIRHADRAGIDKLLTRSREKIRAGLPALAARKADDDPDAPPGAKGPSLLTEGGDGDNGDAGGGAPPDPGGSQDEEPKTAEKKKDSGSNMSSNDMTGIMSAVSALMAQQNQPKPVVDNSCNGPTPGPYCPPKHACFTNPSSLECKCSEYGPGGTECGRMAALPTERNLGGNKLAENFEEPPPPDLTNSAADPGIAAHQVKDKRSSAIPQQGGGGAGISANNSSGALTAKKPPRRSGGSAAAGSGGTSQGYMSSGSVAVKGGSTKGGGGNGGKEKVTKSEFDDPTLQGVKMHYGKMLQAGFESAKRRTAGTQQGIISKELRPASDDIFKAVSDMYQLKLASLLR